MEIHTPSPTGASDEEWAFVVPDVMPMDEAGPQCRRRLKVEERAG